MSQFKIPNAFPIPYFDHGKSLGQTIKHSSSRRGVHIGKHVYIGLMCNIDNAYPEYVFLEDNSSLAGEVTVIAHSNPFQHFEGVIEAKVSPVVVRKGAWVSVRSTLLCGADIGEYAIVSAGSVVSNKVHDYTMVVGNPAKKVFEFDYILKKDEQS